MKEKKKESQLSDLISLAMGNLGVAVSIIDTKGILLYYNEESAKILSRKPEFIGNDIHTHHKKAGTNEKLDAMLKAFSAGRTEPFHYEARPYGEVINVTLTPLIKDGQFVGCVQSVRLRDEVAPNNEQS
jgi:sensor histidine kinase regulating citrate/malate metabolism